MAKLKAKFNSPVLANIFKGAIIAVSITLVLILLFAILIKIANIPDSVITPVNQVIKIVSIFVGCFLTLKKYPQKGLITGASIGAVYTILAFLVFSLLGGTFSINLSFLSDLFFSLIIGGLCGIFAVNKKLK